MQSTKELLFENMQRELIYVRIAYNHIVKYLIGTVDMVQEI